VGLLIDVVVVGAQDTTRTPVGPGVMHTSIYDPRGPWAIHLIEVDLTNPYITLETVKAKDQLEGNERTSAMARRSSREGHRVVAAINGDFYDTGGIPINLQVIGGEILRDPSFRSVFGVATDEKPFIQILSLRGSVIAKDRSTYAISGVNRTRHADEVIFYNHFFSPSTRTNQWGAEVTLQPLKPFFPNDTLRAVLTALDSLAGNQPIPKGRYVLSGHGAGRRFLLDHGRLGDTLAVFIGLPPLRRAVAAAIGGLPRLVRDGRISIEAAQEGASESLVTNRHPRTAVGISRDSTVVYLFTVDGRQPGYSAGMSLPELADWMLRVGCYHAVNLDGGGSTTMVVRDSVVNRPSDLAGERAVANALLVISTAPTGPLVRLEVLPKRLRLLRRSQWQFKSKGFDEFYNPLDLSHENLTWRCDPRIGEITAAGLFTAASRHDSGYVWVSKGSVRDSAFVVVDVLAKLSLLPSPVILRVGESQAMTPKVFDTGGRVVNLSRSDYQWSVTGDVGTISPTGVFTATDTGRGWIEARIDTLVSRSRVVVDGESQGLLDDFQNIEEWSLDGLGVHLEESAWALNDSLYVSPPTSGQLRYSFTRGVGANLMYLKRDLPISGTPSVVAIQVFGDSLGHRLRGEFVDREGENFYVDFPEKVDWAGRWKEISASLSEARPGGANPAAHLDFPITWKQFTLYLRGGTFNQKVRGVLYFDDFTARYSITDVWNRDLPLSLSAGYALGQNYPNPFNQVTVIPYVIPPPRPSVVTLAIYDLLGAKVRTLVQGSHPPGRYRVTWDGRSDAGLPVSSGVYFSRMTAKNLWESIPSGQAVRRIVLVR